MRLLLTVLAFVAASPAMADCQQTVEIEVVPGAQVIGARDYDMTGRPRSVEAIKPAAPDVFQALMTKRGWQKERELSFAVSWPEAPTLQGSLAAQPKWIVNLGRYRHVAGKYIAVTAAGPRGTWHQRWTLTADHAIFLGRSPRAFRSVTLALHNSDGSLEAERTFALPDWKAYARALPAAQTRLQRELAAKALQCLHPPTVPPPPVR